MSQENTMPLHPGQILRDDYLLPLSLTVTQLAQSLGVTRNTLSDLLNGHSGISPQMAIRLSMAFDTTAELWLNFQLVYDLWKARQKFGDLQITRIIKPGSPLSS
jgi:addiction module HigA family antidote